MEPVEESVAEAVGKILEEAANKITEEPVEEISEGSIKEVSKEPVIKEKPIDDVTIKFIRNELRRVHFHRRKTYRDRSVNEFRTALGKQLCDVEYTTEFVKTEAIQLRKKTLDAQAYSALQMALIQSENHINEFFKVANAVLALGRDLSGCSTQAKLAAANCCCNLSLGNSKACAVLTEFVGPYLIAELESANEPLVEVCAWTIGNVACRSSKAFKILHAQACIKSLIVVAEKSSDELLPALSYALLRYIYTGYHMIEQTDIIQVGEILAAKYPKISDHDTLWLLALLSSKDIKKYDFLIKCTPALCNFLIKNCEDEIENIDKFTATLRILTNLVTEPTGEVANHLFQNEFYVNSNFFEDLLANEYPHIKTETLWLIGNLYNHPVESIREQIKNIVNFLQINIANVMKSYKALTSKNPKKSGTNCLESSEEEEDILSMQGGCAMLKYMLPMMVADT